uniref:Peptidase_M14 domain-containing protein n=1 Tax=Syphacia muris TaxID=451379 RepID=A0A0N5AIL0_9BILA
LVSNYGIDPEITSYVNKLNFYVFPILNPDGYVFSRTSNDSLVRQWRKNRAPSNCSGYMPYRERICCYGVDLNRNYDFEFNQSNIRFNNPCNDEYQGPFPFSEPETRAVRDYLLGEELRDNVDLLISFHTHGEMIILPYNHKRNSYPGDYHDLQQLAQKASEKIREDGSTDYQIGTAADMVGPATGGASDWIKNNTSIKYVYVIELPPDLSTSFAFQMKPHWLYPTFTELWRGLKVFINEIIQWREL